MAEPTPGPWTVGKAEKRGWPIEAERTALEYRVVAMAYSPEDARLIAKARHLPELVEALEAVNAVTRIGDDMDFAEAFGAAMHKVRAALALVQEQETAT